jgi:hypothetical protein
MYAWGSHLHCLFTHFKMSNVDTVQLESWQNWFKFSAFCATYVLCCKVRVPCRCQKRIVGFGENWTCRWGVRDVISPSVCCATIYERSRDRIYIVKYNYTVGYANKKYHLHVSFLRLTCFSCVNFVLGVLPVKHNGSFARPCWTVRFFFQTASETWV